MANAAHEWTECPNCGERFRAGRLACPECGSDADTGWRDAEDIDYMAIDIPDYYPDDDAVSTRRSRLWTWIAALLALLGMLAFAVWR